MKVYSISKLEDLDRLPPPRFAPARIGVRLTVPGFDESKRADTERRLARALAACGCSEGSIAMILYLVVVPILAIAGPLAPHSLLDWLALFGGLILVSIVGKLVGLAIARLRFLKLVNELEGAFLARPVEA
jgi:hypothetical protein